MAILNAESNPTGPDSRILAFVTMQGEATEPSAAQDTSDDPFGIKALQQAGITLKDVSSPSPPPPPASAEEVKRDSIFSILDPLPVDTTIFPHFKSSREFWTEDQDLSDLVESNQKAYDAYKLSSQTSLAEEYAAKYRQTCPDLWMEIAADMDNVCLPSSAIEENGSISTPTPTTSYDSAASSLHSPSHVDNSCSSMTEISDTSSVYSQEVDAQETPELISDHPDNLSFLLDDRGQLDAQEVPELASVLPATTQHISLPATKQAVVVEHVRFGGDCKLYDGSQHTKHKEGKGWRSRVKRMKSVLIPRPQVS